MRSAAPWRDLPPHPPTTPLGGPSDDGDGPPGPPPPTAPAPWWRRRGRRGIAAGLGLLLVAGGFAAGRLAGPGDVTISSTDPGGAATPAPTPADPDGASVAPDADGRSSGPGGRSADEPVADVASRLAPSVVAVRAGAGTGSGFALGDDGRIVTASHVLGGAVEARVTLPDGREVGARVAVDRPDLDLAVLVAPEAAVPSATAAEGAPRVGQLAVAIGSPYGLDQTVSSGVVSALDRTVPLGGRRLSGLIQTDAPINPGSSGGPLADRSGRVMGVNVAIASRSGGNDGVGFAVPVAAVLPLLGAPADGADRPEAAAPAPAPPAPVPPLGDRFGGLPGAIEVTPPRFGWLPPGYVHGSSSLERADDDGDVTVRARIVADAPGDVLSFELAPAIGGPADRAGTTERRTLAVGRNDAVSWRDGDRRWIAWEAVPGHLATVEASATLDAGTLARVAAQVTGPWS